MYKLEKLKKDHPKELEEVVNILYADIYPTLPKYKRSPNIYFRFNALGHEFHNKKATTNYINFILLISKILDKSIIFECLGKYGKSCMSEFPPSVRNSKSEICKISDDFYVSVNNGTPTKKSHIIKLCKSLNSSLEII
jgi:hypothetical protein